MAELLLGCGNSREKKVAIRGTPETFEDLTTLDIDPHCGADVVFNLDLIWQEYRLLPFEHDTFDEVHAYEVLEHIGEQGHVDSFFLPFIEIWRVLKPGGLLVGTCPARESRWAWGDPGHRRIVGIEQVTFLDQTEYQRQVGITPMSDYRWLWPGDFEPVVLSGDTDTFVFVLRAHKPPRTERST